MDEKEKSCPGTEEMDALAAEGCGPGSDFESHLASCPACRMEWERRLRLDAAVRASFPLRSDCPGPEKTAAFIDNALSSEELRRFEQHVASCASCREEMQALQALAAAPEETPVGAKAMAAVKFFAPRIPLTAMPSLSTRLVAGIAAAAAGFLIALAILYFTGKGGETAPADAVDPGLSVYAHSDPAGTDRSPATPEVEPSAPETVENPAPEPIAPTPESDPEEVAPPAPESAPETPETPAPKETVEGPATPAEETPSTPERTAPEPPRAPLPDVTEVAKSRRWETRSRGYLLARPAGSPDWNPLPARCVLSTGVSVQTPPSGLGLLEIGNSGVVVLREGSELKIIESNAGLHLRLDAGEFLATRTGTEPLVLLCAGAEISAGEGARIGVLQRRDRADVFVLEGSAACLCQEETAKLEAGDLLRTKTGSIAGKPTPFDVRRAGRWAEVFEAPRIELFFDNFDGAPRNWSGKYDRKTTFRRSRGSLKAKPVKDPHLACAVMKVNHKPLFSVVPGVRLSMHVLLTEGSSVEVRLWDPKAQTFHRMEKVPVEPGKWSFIDLSPARALAGKVKPGTVVTGLAVGTSVEDAELWIDEVAVHRVPGPAPVRLGGFTERDLEPRCGSPGSSTCLACRVARILELLRDLDRRQTVDGAGEQNGRKTPGGEGNGEAPPETPETPQAPPAPPAQPPVPPGTMPPPPGFPGPVPPGPVPPAPVPPRPQGNGGTTTPDGEPQGGGDAGEGATAEPKNPTPPSEPTPENILKIKRWLREQLPLQWPPYPGWSSRCAEGRHCSCLNVIRKYLDNYRLKEDE